MVPAGPKLRGFEPLTLACHTRHALANAAAPSLRSWSRPAHNCPLGTAVVPCCPLLHAPDMPQGRLWLMSHLSALPNGAQPPIPMLALRGLDIAAEVDGHAGRIAHGPRIVTGFDGGNIARTDLILLSTVGLDAQPARSAVQQVRRLARPPPGKR